jgi:hypothetical protein
LCRQSRHDTENTTMLGELLASLKVMSLELVSASNHAAAVSLPEDEVCEKTPVSEHLPIIKTRNHIKVFPGYEKENKQPKHAKPKKYSQFTSQTTFVVNTREHPEKNLIHIRAFRNGKIGIPRGQKCDDSEMDIAVEILLANVNMAMGMDLIVEPDKTRTSLENYLSKLSDPTLRIWLPMLRPIVEGLEHMSPTMRENYQHTNMNIERRGSICVKFVKRLAAKKTTSTSIDFFTSGKVNFTNVMSTADAVEYHEWVQTILREHPEIIYVPKTVIPPEDNSDEYGHAS